jgi:hypothetical protein
MNENKQGKKQRLYFEERKENIVNHKKNKTAENHEETERQQEKIGNCLQIQIWFPRWWGMKSDSLTR